MGARRALTLAGLTFALACGDAGPAAVDGTGSETGFETGAAAEGVASPSGSAGTHGSDGAASTSDGSSGTVGISGETTDATGTDGSGEDGTGTSGGSPSCCGCLCADENWSCSEDTCLDEDGAVLGLNPEAGFVEVPSSSYTTHSQVLDAPRSRVWYAYHPATDVDAPVLLFFNGGPGSSTGPLFGFNTAPFSVDPDLRGDDDIVPTPEPWTRFGHLLHVDAPGTGFSYDLETRGGERPPVGIDPDRDAGVVIRVLLRFLEGHPELADNPVMIVGESYGGVRGTLVLHHLLHYRDLVRGTSDYQDAALYDAIAGHWERTRPGEAAGELTPAQVSEQFGHFVVIQGVVGGQTQLTLGNGLLPANPPGCIPNGDRYQCDEADGWTFDRIYDVSASLVQPDVLQQALGVDPATIAWLDADERVGVYGRDRVAPEESARVDLSEMEALFGALEPGDRHYIGFNYGVNSPRIGARRSLDDGVGDLFVGLTVDVDVLMTNAPFDKVVWGPGIPAALEARSDLVAGVVHEEMPRAGDERPGWIQLEYDAMAFPGVAPRELRFPFYGNSGHIVTLRESPELLSDIETWFDG